MSYAVVMGFRTDTHITLDQYAWLGSIFCKRRHLAMYILLGSYAHLGQTSDTLLENTPLASPSRSSPWQR
jgi:hypothetical protein